jgi:hypothetical protein
MGFCPESGLGSESEVHPFWREAPIENGIRAIRSHLNLPQTQKTPVLCWA